MDDALFAVITAHCFFACGHIERALDSLTVHDQMEDHYSRVHSARIASLGYPAVTR